MSLDLVLPACAIRAHGADERLGLEVDCADVSPHPVLLVAKVVAVCALVPDVKVLQLDVVAHGGAELGVGAAAARRLRNVATFRLFRLLFLVTAGRRRGCSH